jgi:hypothetical protein
MAGSPNDWNNSVTGRADAAVLAGLPGPLAVVLGESIPRSFASLDTATLLVSGRMHLVSVPLQEQYPVHALTFFSDSAGMVSPLTWFFALYTASSAGGGPLALCVQTPAQFTAGWAANTAKRVAFTAPYTPTYTGIHFAAVMCSAGGQTPNLTSMAQPGHVAAVSPARSMATTATGFTNTAPDPCGATTSQANVPYCYLD